MPPEEDRHPEWYSICAAAMTGFAVSTALSDVSPIIVGMAAAGAVMFFLRTLYEMRQ
jgi:hypothetical protein